MKHKRREEKKKRGAGGGRKEVRKGKGKKKHSI